MRHSVRTDQRPDAHDFSAVLASVGRDPDRARHTVTYRIAYESVRIAPPRAPRAKIIRTNPFGPEQSRIKFSKSTTGSICESILIHAKSSEADETRRNACKSMQILSPGARLAAARRGVRYDTLYHMIRSVGRAASVGPRPRPISARSSPRSESIVIARDPRHSRPLRIVSRTNPYGS
jgi:hypothetical protein